VLSVEGGVRGQTGATVPTWSCERQSRHVDGNGGALSLATRVAIIYAMQLSKKVIYDFGANNGDDVPYYLLKADLVVAVEANPRLCDAIAQRFAKDISDGRLLVENCVLSEIRSIEPVPFFVHPHYDVFSQFPVPNSEVVSEFDKIFISAKMPSSIVGQYGTPHYIKVDVEHNDSNVLRELFSNSICPAFISSESHDAEVFATLVSVGRYKWFRLLDGPSVSKKYRNARIQDTLGAWHGYSFPYHSAGPFGDDIEGGWISANDLLELLAFGGMGWKDIHATNLPDIAKAPPLRFHNLLAEKLLGISYGA
jgi:FkbM family methyltransferase